MSGATQLYVIALGSNRPRGRYGRPAQVIEAAVAALDEEFGLFDASPIIGNPAVGHVGRDFANAVALVESDLLPPDMLRRLKQLERTFGRRPGKRWGPRVLDLDIIAWSGGSWRSRRLTVPHPSATDRDFVIAPFAMIAPQWRINGNLTARQAAARLGKPRPRR